MFSLYYSRLRNELKYSCKESLDDSINSSTSVSSLAKIQHLEELVFDLEASENSLQRELRNVNRHDTKLERHVTDARLDNDKMV